MSEIVVPKWGLTTEEVVLLKWYKQVGDQVAVDEPVAEAETDKVTQEIVSQIAGTVTELLVEEGDELTVGQPIVRIDP
ncbi:biotin attachment protein [Prauserella marina]|uniref:Pyruvate dehydrogenase E2 component (Dihydrolipoamide acetyltransferase)/2-oxoglutarate dehydrogenase E2 component (Dihydrolipoamide succinyltransferase) n=1 Tax=Prauserella marina TaxID=530584 RepID=A0A222VU93_9PSEU|nr:biotin/lipoyl-containing protein [Prauserella marina]ASR37392.1 biotin attachment protein [Prauserella marina]PWV74733.1 biotin-dependent enzyme [Prauserella marina]SDD42148.1 pyruvate dehydrogenase E2 component (dihydrolipoamide acetyltransferase)/2-oxoglutarate dehydrogenase E2 component (dihydrolipoamide succinyltransferase) [Prauserella marina]